MKYFSFFIFLFSFAFASCSKSDEAPSAPESGDQTATFNIEAPATRAPVADLTRYIVEAYEGKDLTKAPLRVEAATGSLTLSLKMNTEYTFVFWADKGIANGNTGYWNATNLQEVKIATGKESTVGEAAYCLEVSFNSKDFEANKTVKLKNATAQVNFVEAAGLAAASNSLTVTYASGCKLNVAKGVITEVTGAIIRTFSGIAKIAKDGIVATDYILAPLNEKGLVNLMVTFNTEAAKAITAVPFQQSYKTNIKGEYSNLYSSVFTVNNEVDDYTQNPDVEFPAKAKIGDFYYTDKTFSSTYTADIQNPCIGIVCKVNLDGMTGKIVGLDKATSVKWSTVQIQTAVHSFTDGAANTARIFALNSYKVNNSQYPAFAWCATKNTATNPAGINWYIPARDELQNEIYANNATLNTALSSASATQLSGNYWSSTEVFASGSIEAPSALYVNVNSGSESGDNKNNNNNVRVVSVF